MAMGILRSLPFIILLALGLPAHALDVVFPAGSRVGLAPPPGVTPSHNFNGFEDATNNVAVVIASPQPEAYAEIERSTSADALRQRGLTFEQADGQQVRAGKAFLVIA